MLCMRHGCTCRVPPWWMYAKARTSKGHFFVRIAFARPAEGFLSPLTPGSNVFCRGQHSGPHLGACANKSPISDSQEIVNPKPLSP